LYGSQYPHPSFRLTVVLFTETIAVSFCTDYLEDRGIQSTTHCNWEKVTAVLKPSIFVTLPRVKFHRSCFNETPDIR
jgi:hypothetical protein